MAHGRMFTGRNPYGDKAGQEGANDGGQDGQMDDDGVGEGHGQPGRSSRHQAVVEAEQEGGGQQREGSEDVGH